MRDRADRNHVAVLATHVEVEQVVRVQPKMQFRLDVDLQRQAELVELVDVGRADEVGQGGENIADADA